MLNVYQLNIFLAVVDSRSFSAAADRVHLTQPAVSLAIRALEKQLGVKLFQRDGPRLELTEAGEALLPAARNLVELSSRTEEAICALRGVVTGDLVLGCSTAAAEHVLPRLIGMYTERYPLVHVSLEMAETVAILDKLRHQEIDVGVIGVKPAEKLLECRKLFDDELVLIVPASHPWAARESVTAQELKGIPIILREPGSGTRQTFLDALRSKGISLGDLDVRMEARSSQCAALAVEAGLGVSVVSRYALRRFAGNIKEVNLEDVTLRR
ncbi:MAG: LysR family transcriptional regulator, partial [Chloroflexota bacterium]